MLVRLCTGRFAHRSARQVVVSMLDEGIHGKTLREAGVSVHCLGMSRGVPSLWAVFTLIRILRLERADILMTWLYAADLAGTIAARAAGVRRLIWNIRCSDLDLRLYPKTTRWTIAALSRLSKIPLAIATNSIAGRKAHELLGYSPRKWYHLPNGIDLDQWQPDLTRRASVRAEFHVSSDTVLIGMVARVDPMKDHDTFFAAAECLVRNRSAIEFLVVGKGSESLDVPALLRGRVHLTGERRDVMRLLHGLDVLVMSSAFAEGFPNVVCEAMAAGVPCVVTDVGDAANLVAETGRVVPPRDPIALAAAVEDLLNMTPFARRQLGMLARERVRQNWSIDQAAERYQAVWADLMELDAR